MTRLEKIILEQLKKGQFGERSSDSTLSSKLNNKFKYGIISFYFVDTHGRGNKYDAFTADQVIERIPKSIKYITYSNGEYIFVIDDQNPTSGKKETTWDVYIINKKKTFPDISDQVFAENKSGQFNQSFIITFKQYDELLKKQNELEIAKEKADAEAAAADAEQPAIEKIKVVVQNFVKGTETIDVNNLGKGTADAKAFQELLWQYGNKYPTQKSTTTYKNFAKFRTKGTDGGWDGDIGYFTKLYITFLYAGLKVNTYAELIEKMKSDLSQVQTESTNYFKGTGINIKLKDLLQEQLLKEQDEFDFAAAAAAVNSSGSGGGGGNAGGGGQRRAVDGGNSTPKPIDTNFTQKSFPPNYTGSGKITYDNKNTFEGSWEDGKKSGKGILKNHQWDTTVEGTWIDGQRNGTYTITYKNGDVRVATYVNNKMTGPATFTPEGGKSVEETWKEGARFETNTYYWNLVVDWVKAEYDFWENGGTGPEGQARPTKHYAMFKQYNYTWDDDEEGAKKAYISNRKIALQWLKRNLQGCVEVTGEDYYTKIHKWIYQIAVEIGDVFQNDRTITLVNPKEGDTITRMVQGEIDT